MLTEVTTDVLDVDIVKNNETGTRRMKTVMQLWKHCVVKRTVKSVRESKTHISSAKSKRSKPC